MLIFEKPAYFKHLNLYLFSSTLKNYIFRTTHHENEILGEEWPRVFDVLTLKLWTCSVYHISQLYGQLLSCHFIDSVSHLKLMFDLTSGTPQGMVDIFSIHSSALCYDSFSVMDLIRGLEKNLPTFPFVVSDSAK